MGKRSRLVLAVACAIHFLHDGFSDLLYVLFPVWAAEFSLSFAEVGVLRAGYSGTLALFQLPAGFLAERVGETRVLAAGTLVTAVAFLLLGAADGFGLLLLFLLLGGSGSATQHPLSSSLVSRAYEEGARRMALGTFNFSGDVGKTVWPALAAVLAAWTGWRWATAGLGSLGVAGAAAVALILPTLVGPGRPPERHGREKERGWGIHDAAGFALLSAIHAIDSASRTVYLTFLPFLLLGKGAGMDTVGLALGLTFAGGAAGKFACGAIAERLGVIRTVWITEAATGLGVLALLRLPLAPALVLLPLIGIALNGTSSVLYGTVPEMVRAERRARGYGLFYTIGIGAGAIAPPLFGALSDRAGLEVTLLTLAGMTFLILPLARALRR
jgi:MFS family permease